MAFGQGKNIFIRDKGDRFKVGDITCRVFKDGTEYMDGPTSGWRKGSKNAES